jgi:integrase
MGISIRKRRRGGKAAYFVDVSGKRPDGSRFRKEARSPIQTREAALQYGREMLEELVRGRYGRKHPTLADFWTDTYEPFTKNNWKPASQVSVAQAFRLHILPVLGAKTLDAIGQGEVEQLKTRLLDGKYAPHTVNNILGWLHRGLTLAVEYKKLEKEHVPSVGLLPVPHEEAEWLEPPEQDRFLAAARHWPERHAFLLLLLDAGLRSGEALGLRWRAVDTQRAVLRVLRTRVAVTGAYGPPKEGPAREVRMSTRLVAVLSQHKSLRDLCFTAPDGSPLTHAMVRDWVLEAARKAGLSKHVTSHSLRHTRTANMVMAGVDERTIMAELGWTTTAMVRRYAHLAPSHRAEAASKVEAFLAGKKEKAENDE